MNWIRLRVNLTSACAATSESALDTPMTAFDYKYRQCDEKLTAINKYLKHVMPQMAGDGERKKMFLLISISFIDRFSLARFDVN